MEVRHRPLIQQWMRPFATLITDGRPCDYDRYAGNDPIEDERRALEVGRQNAFNLTRLQGKNERPNIFRKCLPSITPTASRIGAGRPKRLVAFSRTSSVPRDAELDGARLFPKISP